MPTSEDGGAGRPHIVGGDLLTLLYTTQLAAISQDPWFSRMPSLDQADFVALDLDPSDGVGFGQVLQVARAIRDELASMGAVGFPKTSGASGLHVYIPLPPGTPYEAGLIFCQIVATVVSHKHPRIATVERAVRTRGKRVYVDYLQNIQGKTLASAYSARASDYAGVSAPLTWDEVESGVDREDFTIATVPARVREVGDLWAGLRKAKGVESGQGRQVRPAVAAHQCTCAPVHLTPRESPLYIPSSPWQHGSIREGAGMAVSKLHARETESPTVPAHAPAHGTAFEPYIASDTSFAS